jgi:hypothetical protein
MERGEKIGPENGRPGWFLYDDPAESGQKSVRRYRGIKTRLRAAVLFLFLSDSFSVVGRRVYTKQKEKPRNVFQGVKKIVRSYTERL